MSAEFILNRVSSGTIDYGSAGRSTASKMLTPSAEVLSAMSFAGVSNYHVALFFTSHGFDNYVYDLIEPLSKDCKKIWNSNGWKEFKPKHYESYSELLAYAVISNYLMGKKKSFKNGRTVLDDNGNAITEHRRITENSLAKIYQVSPHTIKSNKYLEKHNELMKYFDFISSEVARKVKNRV